MKQMDTSVKRGDIFYADLSPVVGSEQGGTRPVLIVQNDTGNKHSPTVIAAAINSPGIFLFMVNLLYLCPAVVFAKGGKNMQRPGGKGEKSVI